ncbi:MAG: C25 family cysteine peptidase, partial [Actinomycetota bacterium]|nr:C25 family cysteine peptidase [Actinomycetota bacterium]
MRVARIAAIMLVAILLLVYAPGIADGAKGLTNKGSFTVSFQFPDVETVDNGDGTVSLAMEGYESSGYEGLPCLPGKVFSIALPPGTRAETVTVKNMRWETLPGSFLVQWGQPVVDMDEPPRSVPAGAVYDSELPYPSQAVVLEGNGLMRTCCIARVMITPLRYYPLQGTLERAAEVDIEISYGAGEEGGDPLLSEPLDGLAEEVIYNYEQARGWYAAGGADVSESGEGMAAAAGDEANYLIITADGLVNAVAPLKAFKQSQGMSVKVATVSSIQTSYPGTDLPERIRNYLIANYIDWGTHYVLLVGTHASLPMRQCYANGADDSLTDYYYSDLTGDWDLNNDGVYGYYWGGDRGEGGVDFYPEVHVGRIACDDPTDVNAICEKMVAFQQDAGDWKHKALLLGAALYFPNESGPGSEGIFGSRDTEKVKDETLDPLGYTSTTMYEKEGITLGQDPTPCDMPLTQANVLAKWPGDFGVVYWHAHGSPENVSRKIWTTDDGDEVPEFPSEIVYVDFISSADASGLDNDHPSVVYSTSCLTAKPEEASSLDKALMKDGAVAFIGASRTVSPFTALDTSFWEYFLEDGYRIGQAFKLGAIYADNDPNGWGPAEWDYIFNLNLYGDPSMSMDPEAPTITGVNPDSGRSSQTVSVTVSGTNFLAGAQVRLRRTGEADICATEVNVVSNNQITCVLDLTDAAEGVWDVVVINPDGQCAILTSGFKVILNAWYLAEGCTDGGMETWVLVQNPNDTPVSVDLTFMTSSGPMDGPQDFSLGPNSRTSFNANLFVTDYNVSTRVEAQGGNVICERAMYGPGRAWAHDSIGVTTTADTWYLAEGCTDGGMETWVLVQNPNDTPVSVDLTFMTSSGPMDGPQ